MNKLIFSIVLSFFLYGVTPLSAQTYAIEHVSGDLYRFQSGGHYSVFLVTEEGVIATDPISKEAAEWLKAEIKERFSKPVKYVLYSHSDADHTTGGEVFAETAEFVSQINAQKVFSEEGHSPVPTTVFDNFYRLELGGKKVELHYPGPSYTNNLVIMHFTNERAVFIVDAMGVNRLPYGLISKYYFPDVIDFLKAAEEIDFDIVIAGHGPIGEKQDIKGHRQYLEVLYETVKALRKKGVGVDEAKAQIQLEGFKHFDNYNEWLPMNIEGLYKILDEEK